MLVDGGTRCHDSLLRHASRSIVTSRPLREARDRQLRQTVPSSREKPEKYYMHFRAAQSLPDRENSEGNNTGSGRDPGRPEKATARPVARRSHAHPSALARTDSRGENLLALLAQLALRPDVPVERHGRDPKFGAERGHGGVPVVVSICVPCPVSTRRPTPRADRVCTVLTEWARLRPRRASFQTTSTSPARRARMQLSSPGRSSRAPVAKSW